MSLIKDQINSQRILDAKTFFRCLDHLKKSINHNGIIKVNKKLRVFTDKSARVLFKKFLLTFLQTQRPYQTTHPLHKHEQLLTFSVFRSLRNESFDQNIPYCRLLGLIIYQLSLFSDNLQYSWCFKEHDQLAFFPNCTHYSLKTQSTFFDYTYLWSKRKLTITMSINYYYLRTLIFTNKPYKEKELQNFC